MKLNEAIEYLNYCSKQTGWDVELEGLSSQELIDLAEDMSNTAELAYNAWKEDHGTHE